MLTFPKVSWSQTSTISKSRNPSSTIMSNVWFQTGFNVLFRTWHYGLVIRQKPPGQQQMIRLKISNSKWKRRIELTLVLFFWSDFFIVITTKGSDFPARSVAGNSSADITVTVSTPLKRMSLFFCEANFVCSAGSGPGRRAFSKEVSLKSALKAFINTLSVP